MTTPPMDGMPPEPDPSPKIYISGTPTPEAPVTALVVDQKVLVTIRADVRQVGEQHQDDGKGPFVKLKAYELVEIRPL